jgi:hypothetical protein
MLGLTKAFAKRGQTHKNNNILHADILFRSLGKYSTYNPYVIINQV